MGDTEMDTLMLIAKIICLLICVLLLFICYRTRTFAKKILKKKDEEITDVLMLKLKVASLLVSMGLFVVAIMFIG